MNNLTNDRKEFEEIIKDIKNHPTVLEMQNFRQHYDTSCYEHCENVAYYSFRVCKKFGLDYRAVSRARNVTRFIFIRLESKTDLIEKVYMHLDILELL